MKLDTTTLKEKLGIDDIISLLNELGSTNFVDERDKGHVIFNTICHNNAGNDSSMKLYYYASSYSFHCFTTCSCSFDIYELVSRIYKQKGIELHFSSVVEIVAEKTGNALKFGFGTAFTTVKKDIIDDWDWINKVSKKRKIEMPEPVTYSDKLLDVFSNWDHPLFTDDFIKPETLREYKVKFYERERRIVIPHYHSNGELLGVRGRTIDKEVEKQGFKYLPITVQGKMFNFSTFQSLYGYYQNASTIQKLRKVAIFESEKSVMQCHSYFGDKNFAVALSGKNISQHQVDMLLDLGVEEVILNFDKMYDRKHEIDEDFVKYQKFVTERAMKFVPYVRTYVVYDKHGLLERDDSPSDKGRQTLMELMATKTEIFNKE